jgi:hypothetical protein
MTQAQDERSVPPAMAVVSQDIYRSANGDCWRLIRDTASERAFVRHEANQPSGGRVTDTDVEAFLRRNGSAPEDVALRRLLNTSPDESR